MTQVLLIEDDPIISEIICDYLDELEEYQVFAVSNAADALARSSYPFDIILLDIMLPDEDGINLCTQLRRRHHCPILFISCIDDTDTIVRALERGGDDYIVKPFEPQILHARIQANLRRVRLDKTSPSGSKRSTGPLTLDMETSTLQNGERSFSLSNMELRILAFLMEHPGQYFTSTELYRKIWGKPSYGDARTVLVHIHNLRKKVEKDPSHPRFLRNIAGKGYIFSVDGES